MFGDGACKSGHALQVHDAARVSPDVAILGCARVRYHGQREFQNRNTGKVLISAGVLGSQSRADQFRSGNALPAQAVREVKA
jgi:hypothetical protein